MKRIYVAHPYGGKKENKELVEKIIKTLVANNPNNLYVSPIHVIGYLYNDVSYNQGMKYCFELLAICNELLLCKGWENSKGCKMEKERAEFYRMKISYYEGE